MRGISLILFKAFRYPLEDFKRKILMLVAVRLSDSVEKEQSAKLEIGNTELDGFIDFFKRERKKKEKLFFCSNPE